MWEIWTCTFLSFFLSFGLSFFLFLFLSIFLCSFFLFLHFFFFFSFSFSFFLSFYTFFFRICFYFILRLSNLSILWVIRILSRSCEYPSFLDTGANCIHILACGFVLSFFFLFSLLDFVFLPSFFSSFLPFYVWIFHSLLIAFVPLIMVSNPHPNITPSFSK